MANSKNQKNPKRKSRGQNFKKKSTGSDFKITHAAFWLADSFSYDFYIIDSVYGENALNIGIHGPAGTKGSTDRL